MATPSIISPRLAAIAQARRSMLQDGAQPPSDAITEWVRRSWQRCLALGLQADEMRVFQQLSQTQMRRTLDANWHLVQTARPILEHLGRAIVNTRYFAILTNRDGVVVDMSGAIDRSDRRADLISRIGTDLSEGSIGTSAIGMALTDLRPVWLHRGEHFYASNSVYSCAGAPVFGPDGVCVGMLDLTGIEAQERPELKHLVTQSANRIENALLLAQEHSLMLRLNWPGNALGGETDGIVCLGDDGWLNGANQIARQMLPQLATPAPERVHLGDVFGVAIDTLYDNAVHAQTPLEIPLWSGLRLQARASAPAHAALQMAGAKNVAQKMSLRDVQATLIRQAVSDARGNVLQAARALGISRATVYRKLGRTPPGS